MKKFFGGKKEKQPPPSLTDASNSANARSDAIMEKIKKIDIELVRYKEQIKKSRGPAQQRAKQKALQLLKQKRMYESQSDAAQQQAFNLDQVSFAQESIKDTVATVEAMKQGAKEMKKQMKVMKIDKIEDVRDDMEDLLDMTREVQDVMSQSFGVPDYVDEDDLEAELSALDDIDESELMGEPSYLSGLEDPMKEGGEKDGEKGGVLPQAAV